MRTITIPPGTRHTTVSTVYAVVRAFDALGVRDWESENVVREVSDFLAVRVGREHDAQRVSYALKWLADHGYLERTLAAGGRRTLAVRFMDDVRLDEVVAAPNETNTARVNAPNPLTERWASYGMVVTKAPQPVGRESDDQTSYRFDELLLRLAGWERHDPVGYSEWVDTVLENLGHRPGAQLDAGEDHG